MEKQESAGSGMFLLGAVAGALVGAGVALLMAPKPGAEMRQDLNQGFNSLRDAAARRYREMADKATAMADEHGDVRTENGRRPLQRRHHAPISESFPSRRAPALPVLGGNHMLTTILVLLVVLWLLGMVSGSTLGGFIHLLLVLAIAVVLIRVIQGRNPSDRKLIARRAEMGYALRPFIASCRTEPGAGNRVFPDPGSAIRTVIV